MPAKKESKLLKLTAVEETVSAPKKTVKQLMAEMKRNPKFAEFNKMQMASDMKAMEVVPTGILGLDHALSVGGFPRGKVIQLYGNESSWKSTICLRTIAEAQKLGGDALWIDAEGSFDKNWAKANGVDVERCGLLFPDTQEDALNTVEHFARNGTSIIVLDSIAALAPHKEKYADATKREYMPLDKEQMGIFAKNMAKFFRRSLSVFAEHGTIFLVVNQLRSSLSPYGSPTSVPGGKALKHANSISINMKRLTAEADRVLDTDKNIIGSKYQFTIDKTRFGVIGTTGSFQVIGTQVDNILTLRDIAVREGIIPKINASNYLVDGEKINGAANVALALAKNPELAREIETQIRSKMGFNVTSDIRAPLNAEVDVSMEDLNSMEDESYTEETTEE